MKRFNINIKERLKNIGISVVLTGIIFSTPVLAVEVDLSDFEANYSNSYIEWLNLSDEEKEKVEIPKTYTVDVPDKVLEKYNVKERNTPSILRDILSNNWSGNRLDMVSASISDSYFHLKDRININVKNQSTTNQCWAFAMVSSLETNMALNSSTGNFSTFSVRHMDYSTAKTFKDGINENGFNREVGSGGLAVMGLAYLTNGQGAVLESDMPFEDNEDQIFLSDIDKKVDTAVTGYATLPTITKEYNSDGSVLYSNGGEEYYSIEEVKEIRNIIKSHIMNDGAVFSFTAGSQPGFYNNTNIIEATAYFCNEPLTIRDHAIAIVGWDDNYSRENFNPERRPSTDGAYIVLNSYGTEVFDGGYLYVSYEDLFIESEIYAITSSKKVDYDKIYQHDFYGGIFAIGTQTTDVGYYANVYQRDSSKDETLTDVGVTIADYVKVEIFANTNGDVTTMDSLKKIGESDGILEPGYHRINVDKTELTGTSFAIVIKQTSENGAFYFSIEANVPDTVYSEVDSAVGQSFISFDGNAWNDLSTINISGVDMKKSDVCIKVFTTVNEPKIEDDNLSVGKYIIDDEYIMKIVHETTINDFLAEITTDFDVTILTRDNEVVTEYDSIVKSGMKMRLSNDVEYMLVVRGDMDCNGKINLTDLSKILLHYNEFKEFILTSYQLKAADMNFDGKVTLTDVSQMVILYNSF